MSSDISAVIGQKRLLSPAVTPQALAWDDKRGLLWMGSRDLRRIYAIDSKKWQVVEELEALGIPWAAIATDGTLQFTIGTDPDDDRYIRQFTLKAGVCDDEGIACPQCT